MAVDWQSSIEATLPARPASRMSAVWNVAVWALALVCLLIFLGPVVTRDALEGVSAITNEQLRFLAVPLALFGAAILATRPISALSIVLAGFSYFLVLGWAIASVLWSVDPGMTSVRMVAIIMVAVAALGLALRFSGLALAELLAVAALVCAGLSLGLYAIGDPLTEAWDVPGVRGAFAHKNTFGQILALGFVCGVGLSLAGRTRLLGLATIGMCAVGLALAQSATAIACVFVGSGLIFLFTMVATPGWPRVLKAAVLVGGAILAIGALISFDAVLNALGRDATLTGRSDIWAFTLDHVRDSPWIGHGFRAFWTAPQNEGVIAASFWNKYDQSHNGYLQVLLDLGGIGLALFIGWMIHVVIVGLRNLDDHGTRIWFAVFLMVQVYAGAEAVFMAPTGFMWLSMTLAGFVVLVRGAHKSARG
jgi:O-antigen ligase